MKTTKINIYSLNRKIKIKKEVVKKIVGLVFRGEKYHFKEVNIIIADDSLLKTLNRKFFKKNRPTNVISFNLEDVAEVYLSSDRAENREQLLFFLVHGLLHICGYDHKNRSEEKFMEKKCLKYLTELC
uniref:Endoribonuclease YbeY n=1 Tax=candidate division WOR-3 bacterium TaxID=2052148 RepID=A0A7C4TAG7_UNCW3